MGLAGSVQGLARAVSLRIEDRSDRAAAATSDVIYPWINSLVVRIVHEAPQARPDYLWGSLHGAHLAKMLGIGSISLIEFGVAGGKGLLSLERIADAIEKHLGVGTSVYGFDTGVGLPTPVDFRDCPNLFSEGYYPMDVELLRKRLGSARLILGPVGETVAAFLDERPDPIAFISFDLDLYSSTRDALAVLETGVNLLLPRVHCYFDDVTGYTYGDFNGERLAVHEFNDRHDTRKISPFYALQHYVPARYAGALWVHKFFLAHVLDHPLYARPDGLTRVARKDLAG